MATVTFHRLVRDGLKATHERGVGCSDRSRRGISARAGAPIGSWPDVYTVPGWHDALLPTNGPYISLGVRIKVSNRIGTSGSGEAGSKQHTSQPSQDGSQGNLDLASHPDFPLAGRRAPRRGG